MAILLHTLSLQMPNNVLHRTWEGGRENWVLFLAVEVAPDFPRR